MGYLRALWRTISSAFLLLAIFQLPKSISDLDANAAPWKKALSQIDQNSALWTFAICSVAYVLWVDVRPSVRKWLGRRHLSVDVQDSVMWESYPIDDVANGDPIYINQCFLVISNRRSDGVTLRNLRVTTFAYGEKTAAKTRVLHETEIDLQNGEVAEFSIGFIGMTKMLGLPRAGGEFSVSEETLRGIRHNVPRGYLSFKTSEKFGFSSHPTPHSWNIWAVVSADDVPSVDVKLEISFATPNSLINVLSIDSN